MTHATQDERIRAGASLFNDGDFYACHEVFEEAWMNAEGGQRLFLQGLVQLAVALHHLSHDNPRGARRLLEEAAKKLRAHEAEQNWVVAGPLAEEAEALARRLDAGAAVLPGPEAKILLRLPPR